MISTILRRITPIFIIAVVIPTMVAIFYFGFFASDIYISESKFVVRTSEKATASPLGMLFGGGGLSNSGEQGHAVIEYAKSRDALRDINRDHLMEKSFAQKGSWFDRFGGAFGGVTTEHLFEYYLGKVQIENDTTTQVTRLTVSAFDPKDAKMINARLLDHAETLVNQLNERSRRDTLSVATTQVSEARENARRAALALSRFRNSRELLDPEKEATVKLQMISKLQDQLVTARTQLQMFRNFTPDSSQIPALRTQVKALSGEIDKQTRSIAGDTSSLSADAVEYQRLQLDSQLADKQLANAMASLQEAQDEARKKHAYIERIVEPNLPDYPMAPRRMRGILATFLLGLLAWGVLTTLIAGIREHRD